jgi:cytochrome c oxidase subunit III
MGNVVSLRPYQKQEQTASVGMVVFLASWAMMFAGLFFSYGFVRSRAPVWPPPGLPALPIALPAINTLVLMCSSLTFALALRELRRGKRAAFTRGVGITILLGFAFLGLQASVWQSLSRAGLHMSSGLYGAVFYTLTIFHALHVAVGLLILMVVLVRSLLGKYSEHNTISVRLCTMFWHFVDVVWILMFVTTYLM